MAAGRSAEAFAPSSAKHIVSRDTDANQRLWESLGYGGKTSPPSTWRYWKQGDRHWVIAAPNDLALFEQRHRSVSYNGEVVVTGKTQWSATWGVVSYFYAHIIPTLQKPPLGKGADA